MPCSLAGGFQCLENHIASIYRTYHHEDGGSIFVVQCWYPPVNYSVSVTGRTIICAFTTVTALKFYSYTSVYRMKCS
jgi:hypothetical protein